MATTLERLTALADATFLGASNPRLIVRAERIAAELAADGHAALATRLRAVHRTRGESLGNRYERLQPIIRDYRAELG